MASLSRAEPSGRTIRLYYPVPLIALLWVAWLGNVALVVTLDQPYLFGPSLGSDYVVYYAAGATVRAGHGHTLYDEAHQRRLQEGASERRISGQLLYHRPPWYAGLFAPLSLLEFRASYALWSALGLAALGASVWLLGAASGRAFAWSLAWPPVFFAFAFGQTILLNLVLLSACFALWRRRALVPAGLVLSLLADKPHLLLGIALLLVLEGRREWPMLAACAAGSALLAAVSWAISPDACAAYVHVLSYRALPSAFAPSNLEKLHSVASFFHLALPGYEGAANTLTVAVGMLAFGGFVAFVRQHRARPELCFAAGTILPFLTVPYALIYDYAMLLVPAVILFRHLPHHDWSWRCAFLGTAAFLALPAVSLQLEHLPLAIGPLVPTLFVICLELYRRLDAPQTENAASPALRPLPAPTPD